MNKLWAILSALCFGVLQTRAQRTYSSSSVLASGNWYKLEIRQSGVYRIDLPWLSAAGINAAGVSSSSIRLFGNGGAMLSESNSGNYTDDLVENAIMVVDGGDGVFNGQDYILFYADGPDKWVQDGAQSFRCEKNIYSNSSFYFLTIGGNGKRISTGGIPVAGGTFLTTYLHRQQHELDTINFLQSGKEWFGEEFMNAPGKEVRRIFSFNLPHLIIQEPVRYSLEVLARSLSTPSSFTISSGNSPI
ncbi:MAG TPA: hypothetical protein VIK74_02515, partial [Parasegetibacter sp.]